VVGWHGGVVAGEGVDPESAEDPIEEISMDSCTGAVLVPRSLGSWCGSEDPMPTTRVAPEEEGNAPDSSRLSDPRADLPEAIAPVLGESSSGHELPPVGEHM